MPSLSRGVSMPFHPRPGQNTGFRDKMITKRSGSQFQTHTARRTNPHSVPRPGTWRRPPTLAQLHTPRSSTASDGDHHHAAPLRPPLRGRRLLHLLLIPAPQRPAGALLRPLRRLSARGVRVGLPRPGLRQEGLPPQPHTQRQLQPQGVRPQEGDPRAHEPGVHQ